MVPQGSKEERGFDLADEAFSSPHFRVYEFKIKRCPRARPHDWTCCPFAHPGEKAKRRDPRRFKYSGTACPDFRKNGQCRRGDACPFAHGVFECWLHPSRYRTQTCTDGTACKRRVCFFAHVESELRKPEEDPVVLSQQMQAELAAEAQALQQQQLAQALNVLLGNQAQSNPLLGAQTLPMLNEAAAGVQDRTRLLQLQLQQLQQLQAVLQQQQQQLLQGNNAPPPSSSPIDAASAASLQLDNATAALSQQIVAARAALMQQQLQMQVDQELAAQRCSFDMLGGRPRGSLDLPRGSLDLPRGSLDLPRGSLDLPRGSLDLPRSTAAMQAHLNMAMGTGMGAMASEPSTPNARYQQGLMDNFLGNGQGAGLGRNGAMGGLNLSPGNGFTTLDSIKENGHMTGNDFRRRMSLDAALPLLNANGGNGYLGSNGHGSFYGSSNGNGSGGSLSDPDQEGQVLGNGMGQNGYHSQSGSPPGLESIFENGMPRRSSPPQGRRSIDNGALALNPYQYANGMGSGLTNGFPNGLGMGGLSSGLATNPFYHQSGSTGIANGTNGGLYGGLTNGSFQHSNGYNMGQANGVPANIRRSFDGATPKSRTVSPPNSSPPNVAGLMQNLLATPVLPKRVTQNLSPPPQHGSHAGSQSNGDSAGEGGSSSDSRESSRNSSPTLPPSGANGYMHANKSVGNAVGHGVEAGTELTQQNQQQLHQSNQMWAGLSNDEALKNAKALLEGFQLLSVNGKGAFSNNPMAQNDIRNLVRNGSFESILAELPRSLSEVALADHITGAMNAGPMSSAGFDEHK